MVQIGIATIDITPTQSVWLTGYGDRDHKSEGVYQPLRAGAVFLKGANDAVLITTADHIGYGSAFAAEAKLNIGEATGLLPRQIVLTATHTHCAPFFSPWIMPGALEPTYAAFIHRQLVTLAVQACGKAQPGQVSWSRGHSDFGVNRRLPDGQGGVLFAPNPSGPMDRDLDTLWFTDAGDCPLGSLTIFGCHPTSLGGYLIGGDYPGFLCRALEQETGAPALFSTGCAGNIRPWYKGDGKGFPRPSYAELEQGGIGISADVLKTSDTRQALNTQNLQTTTLFHPLPYAELPAVDLLKDYAAQDEKPRQRDWARAMLPLHKAGGLPTSCPQEIQLIQLEPGLRLVFLGGEILTEIGLRLKADLGQNTTITVAYSNGLIGYVPGKETYPLGGYEVDGSFYYFLRAAPFSQKVEDLIATRTQNLASTLS
jgi:neutral ceramidase